MGLYARRGEIVAPPRSSGGGMTRPNILYIHSHDTGRYVQPYGYAVATPHIQRLADEGVLFRRAFCAAPTCSPSRAALLTGQSPHSAGMLGLAHRGWALRDYGQHLLHTLRREAGYFSALFGIQHLARQTDDAARNGAIIGYDLTVTPSDDTAAKVAGWLHAAARERQPFFLDVGFFESHRIGQQEGGFNPGGQEGDARHVAPLPLLPDAPEVRGDVADYAVAVARLDAKIGQVLDALDVSGLADTTLVVCTTDHGPPFPAMKCNLTDAGMGVMLLMRGPGGFTGGRVVEAMVSQLDVFPTLCDLLAIPHPAWLQGASLLPLVHGERTAVHDAVFAEVSFHAAYEPQRAVRTARWKYIRRFAPPPLPGTNCDGGPSKELWLRQGWTDRLYAAEQLYDLVFDPHEGRNQIGDPDARVVLDDLRERLTRWMQATDDPLLHGPIPAPPGT